MQLTFEFEKLYHKTRNVFIFVSLPSRFVLFDESKRVYILLLFTVILSSLLFNVYVHAKNYIRINVVIQRKTAQAF